MKYLSQFQKTNKQKKMNLKKTSAISMAVLPLAACGDGVGSPTSPTPTPSVPKSVNFTESSAGIFIANNDATSILNKQSATTDLIVLSKAGNDTIMTGSGNDIIRPGFGEDTVNAGAGDDSIILVGVTRSGQFEIYDITNTGGTGLNLSSVLSLETLNNQAFSEVTTGKTIDGGAGYNTLFVYGNMKISDIHITNFQKAIITDTFSLSVEQFAEFSAIEGNRTFSIIEGYRNYAIVNIEDNGSDDNVILDMSKIVLKNIRVLSIDDSVTIQINDLGDLDGIASIMALNSNVKLEILGSNTEIKIKFLDIFERFHNLDELILGEKVVLDFQGVSLYHFSDLSKISGTGEIDTEGSIITLEALKNIDVSSDILFQTLTHGEIVVTNEAVSPIVSEIEGVSYSDVVVNPVTGQFIFSTKDGFIKVWDPVSWSVTSEYNIGGTLGGVALTSDGSVYIATGEYVLTQDTGPWWDHRRDINIKHLNLDTGIITRETLNVEGSELGTSDISIDENGIALFTTDYSGSGWNPFHQYNINTSVFSIYSELASVRQSSYLETSEDGRYILIQENNISSAPLHLYDAETKTIIAQTDNFSSGVSGFNSGKADVNSAVGMVAVSTYNDTAVFDLSLNRIFTLNSLEGVQKIVDVQFSILGDLLYAVDPAAGKIFILNTSDWTIASTMDITSVIFNNTNAFGTTITLGVNGKALILTTNDYSDGGKTYVYDLEPHHTLVEVDGHKAYLLGQSFTNTFSLLEDNAYVILEKTVTLTSDVGIHLTGSNSKLFNKGVIGGDVIFGEGNDLIVGQGTGSFLGQIKAGGGSDIIHTGSENNIIFGETGNDYIEAGGGNDTIYGGMGDDTIKGGGGADIINAGTGNDVIKFDLQDTIDGGEGRDTLIFDGAESVIDLANVNAVNIETIDMSVGDNLTINLTVSDVIKVTDSNNILIIDGSSDDAISSLNQSWVKGQDTTINDETYHLYYNGTTTVLVDADIIQDFS